VIRQQPQLPTSQLIDIGRHSSVLARGLEWWAMAPHYNDNLVAHYKIFRDYLEHEDDLINHRSTWHHTIQGLLFTALGVTLSKVDPTATRQAAAVQKALILLLPVLGMSISLAAFLSIRAATLALDALRKQWEELIKAYREDPWPTLPPLTAAGNRWAIKRGKTPAYVIPCVIGVAWLFLLLIALWHLPIKG
jgi:hypothetical protein